MGERVFSANGQIIHEVDGKVIWASNLAPCNLLPNPIVKNDFEISWPDYPKGCIYGYDENPGVGIARAYCATWITIRPSEYTSNAIELGSVPAGVNYLHVKMNMYRSKSPSQYFGSDVPPLFREYEEQFLDGGSCLVERFAHTRRGFYIYLENNKVWLKSTQSSRDVGDAASPYVQDYDDEGWTWSGDRKGFGVSFRDNRSDTNFARARRGGANACSMDDNTDYSLKIKGTLTITPGIVAL